MLKYGTLTSSFPTSQVRAETRYTTTIGRSQMAASSVAVPLATTATSECCNAS